MAEALEQRRQAANEARTTPLSCGNRRGKRSNYDRRKRRKKLQPQESFNTQSYGRSIQYACDLAFPAPSPFGQKEGESNAARLRRLTDKQREDLTRWQKEHRWSPNQLRHAKATEIRKEFGIELARMVLGHAAISTTELYAERDAEQARIVVRKIG